MTTEKPDGEYVIRVVESGDFRLVQRKAPLDHSIDIPQVRVRWEGEAVGEVREAETKTVYIAQDQLASFLGLSEAYKASLQTGGYRDAAKPPEVPEKVREVDRLEAVRIAKTEFESARQSEERIEAMARALFQIQSHSWPPLQKEEAAAQAFKDARAFEKIRDQVIRARLGPLEEELRVATLAAIENTTGAGSPGEG